MFKNETTSESLLGQLQELCLYNSAALQKLSSINKSNPMLILSLDGLKGVVDLNHIHPRTNSSCCFIQLHSDTEATRHIVNKTGICKLKNTSFQ